MSGINSENPYFRDRRYPTSRWHHKLWHYPSSILSDIYPLSKTEYRAANLARRASYDYLTQTVEACAEWCREEARTLLGEIGQTSMQETFIAAARFGIVPSNLGEDLASLAQLRNEVIHENARVDKGLLVYDRLLQLIMVGFASRVAVDVSETLDSNEERSRFHFPIVVDRQFVRSSIRGWPGDKSAGKALERLAREAHPPRYVINARRAQS